MRLTDGMAKLVYLDETGSVGKGAKKQPLLTVAAVVVDEEQVRALAEEVREVAMKHLGWAPADLELHGHEIWQGQGYWKGKSPAELIAAYEAAVRLLKDLDIHVAFASIHKQRLHDKYGGGADGKRVPPRDAVRPGEDRLGLRGIEDPDRRRAQRAAVALDQDGRRHAEVGYR